MRFLIGGGRAGTAAALVLLVGYAPVASAQPGFGPPFVLGRGVGPLAIAASPDATVWAAAAGAVGPPAGRSQVTLWIRRPSGVLLGPRAFGAAPGYQVEDVHVAAGSGWAVVAWHSHQPMIDSTGHLRPGGRDELQAVRCAPGGCGPVRTVVSLPPSGGPSVASLQVAAVGRRALLLWLGLGNRRGVFTPQVKWTASDTRGRYDRPRTLGDASFDSQSVTALVAAAHSRAVVAWVRNIAGAHVPVASERVEIAEFAGHGFGRVHDAPGPPGVDPQLATAGGEVLLAWRGGFGDSDMTQGSGPVYVASQPAGQARFGPAQTVAACACDQVRLAASGTGRAILAFEDLGPLDAAGAPVSAAAVMVSLREPGSMFSPPSPAPSPSSLDAVLSTDAAGVATLAWTAGPTLYAAQAPPSQPLGAPTAVASASAPVTVPGVCAPCGPGGHTFQVPLSQPSLLALDRHTLLTWQLPPTDPNQQSAPAGLGAPHPYQAAVGP